MRRLLAVQVATYVYQLIRVKPADPIPPRFQSERKPQETTTYNAPAELPGLRFEDPVKKPVAPRVMFLNRSERSQQYELS